MKLNYDRKSEDPTYFVQLGIRNGKKTTTKNVARIGKHSELLKITDDPLTYAKEQVKKYNEEYKNKNCVSLEIKVDFAEKIKATGDNASHSALLNIGYFFLQQFYHDLKMDSFFESATADMKNEFDPNLINRFLTYSRILYPDSKLGTHQNLCRFYEQPAFDYVHILRTMDILQEHYEEYISHLFEASCQLVKRDTSVCFYDCSNYYFEIETDDEDYVDEVTGETIKGLRKYGPSKEHRPNPIVEMGLFMDRDGIPLSMCITSGSDNEQTTAIPLEKQLTKMLKGKKFIYCADAGLGSLNIRNFNSMGGRAFIVTSSTKSGEKITDQYTIDQSVIEEEEKYDGFYAVATNLDDPAKDILEVSANRYKIEDCFRVMKTNLSARPVFHQKRERIIAHFMICYTALLIYRLMEKKLDLQGTHYTADTLIETMKSMDVANIEDMCYMSTYTSSEACTALNAITGLGLDKKYYQPKELNKKIIKILK